MTLTVEDGTGIAAADALISLSYWQAYADAQGFDYVVYSDEFDIEPAIRRGSRYISDSYAYAGTRGSRDQAFSFPRYGITDQDGYAVPSDAVPVEVQKAAAEAAWRELQEVGSLNPDSSPTGGVTKEKVGPLEVTYSEASSGSVRPKVGVITDLLAGLLDGSAGGVVRLVRA